ncbi:MAG TPA: hypothetical protein VHM92_02985 [Allosphingosinicella sp.]|nr:hypothetical protein [Allosphingosinicella sp.]
MRITLNAAEMARLFQQDPDTRNDGGWQQLLVSLQNKTNRPTGELDLDQDDLEKIPRYAFDYKQGGWEDTLIAIFSRTLGPKLGRP